MHMPIAQCEDLACAMDLSHARCIYLTINGSPHGEKPKARDNLIMPFCRHIYGLGYKSIFVMFSHSKTILGSCLYYTYITRILHVYYTYITRILHVYYTYNQIKITRWVLPVQVLFTGPVFRCACEVISHSINNSYTQPMILQVINI